MFRQVALLSTRIAVRASSGVTAKCFASSLVTSLDTSVNALPLREAVRYSGKNLKWTARDFLNYSEAHANALIEHGFKSGETIALWIPEGAEKHVTLVAAAKAGLKVVDIDTNITEVSEIRKALSLANAKAIYFNAEHGEHNYLKLLRKSIPEFFEYDDSHGQFFHSKHFPSLQFFIHLGFDNEMGCLNYKELFLREPPTNYVHNNSIKLNDETPLYSQIVKGANGVELSGLVSHGKVLDAPSWSFAKKIVNREYFETV